MASPGPSYLRNDQYNRGPLGSPSQSRDYIPRRDQGGRHPGQFGSLQGGYRAHAYPGSSGSISASGANRPSMPPPPPPGTGSSSVKSSPQRNRSGASDSSRAGSSSHAINRPSMLPYWNKRDGSPDDLSDISDDDIPSTSQSASHSPLLAPAQRSLSGSSAGGSSAGGGPPPPPPTGWNRSGVPATSNASKSARIGGGPKSMISESRVPQHPATGPDARVQHKVQPSPNNSPFQNGSMSAPATGVASVRVPATFGQQRQLKEEETKEFWLAKMDKRANDIKAVEHQLAQIAEHRKILAFEVTEQAKPEWVDNDSNMKTESARELIRRVYAENKRKREQQVALPVEIVAPSNIKARSLFPDPCQVPEVQRTIRSFKTFKPVLIEYLRRQRAADDEKEWRLAKEYVRLKSAWRNKTDAILLDPATAAADTARRELFLEEFPELHERFAEDGLEAYIPKAALQLTPAQEASKLEDLASEKRFRPAKCPSQLLGYKKKSALHLNNTNGLVKDSVALQMELQHLGHWTAEEKVFFAERMIESRHQKPFAKIAEGLPHKTTAECVKFYYTSKKDVKYKEKRKTRYLQTREQNQLRAEERKRKRMEMKNEYRQIFTALQQAEPNGSSESVEQKSDSSKSTEDAKVDSEVPDESNDGNKGSTTGTTPNGNVNDTIKGGNCNSLPIQTQQDLPSDIDKGVPESLNNQEPQIRNNQSDGANSNVGGDEDMEIGSD